MGSVFLGLGANLGERRDNILSALAMMESYGVQLLARSSFYETEPWGILDQPRFLNAAAHIDTTLPPHALLDCLKSIEIALGRTNTIRNGPRPIDLDILLYGELRINTPRLTIPHPGMLQRATVLVPLAEIAGEVRHPLSGRTIAAHLADLGPTPAVALYPPGLQ